MNKQMYDRLEEPLANYHIIEIFTFMKQSVKERTIIVLTRVPKIHRNDLTGKIGVPRDFAENVKTNVFTEDCDKFKVRIPTSNDDIVMDED